MDALSGSNVWATAYSYGRSSPGPVLLLHWTGHAWHKITGWLPAGSLSGPIASDGHGGLWLVTETATRSYFEHYSGGIWTRKPLPGVPGGAISVSALDLIPGTRSLWGTGSVNAGFASSSATVILKYGN